jgi:hypothetical protein
MSLIGFNLLPFDSASRSVSAMSRTYTPVDLVQLPRVDAHGAVALATAIEAAASPYKDLSAMITETLSQIGSDKQFLLQALAKTPQGAITVKEADRRIDRVAGAFHDISAAWSTLAEFLPQGEAGQTLMVRLFADGRRFVNLKVQEEWAAIETKLTTIDREGLDAQIQAIGAAPIVTLLRQFHTVYGAVIGTTQPLEEAPEIRDTKDALLDSIRTYVIQVTGTVKRGKPETAALADVLLKPVREWVSTRSSKESPEPAAPPQGAGSSSGNDPAGTKNG